MSDKYSISKTTIDKVLEILDSFKWDAEFGLEREEVNECIKLINQEINANNVQIVSNEEKTTTKVPKVRRIKYL